MSHQLPPLIALRAFEAVARTGSVRAAGNELSVSHTAVSRHIQNLQDRVGVAFFEREGRGLTLTGAGKRLLSEDIPCV
ncbi:LysR family transcriptional regulator [Mesorhizobium sp. M0954]|uniref:LysR family transcriptional regulator n=1 Tax=Mesorhizobium sp. M0954 TaxID=2957032 RepID=UPI0033384A5C